MSTKRPLIFFILGTFALVAGCGSATEADDGSDPDPIEASDGIPGPLADPDDGSESTSTSEAALTNCNAPAHCPMTNQEAKSLAFCLGYSTEVRSWTCKTGTKVYTDRSAPAWRRYITKDVDCHGGGRYWKALSSTPDCKRYYSMNHNLTQCLASK